MLMFNQLKFYFVAHLQGALGACCFFLTSISELSPTSLFHFQNLSFLSHCIQLTVVKYVCLFLIIPYDVHGTYSQTELVN